MPGDHFEYTMVRFGDRAAPLASTEVRILVGVVLVLVSFGVWLGRNVRVNSWDVLRPWRLATVVWSHLRAPGAAANALGFTVVATLFFATMYLVVVGPMAGGSAVGPQIVRRMLLRSSAGSAADRLID